MKERTGDFLLNTKMSKKGNKVFIQFRIPSELSVSEYEYRRFRYTRPSFFFQCNYRKQEFEFVGEGMLTVRQMMSNHISYTEFVNFARLMISVWKFTQQNDFRFQQIAFHPDYILYDPTREAYQLMYLPLYGGMEGYSFGMFFLDFITATDMNEALRRGWLAKTARATYCGEQCNWGEFLEAAVGGVHGQYFDGQDDEAPTGFEGNYAVEDEAPTGFESYPPNQHIDDEAPTGFEGGYAVEDEAPTGFEGGYPIEDEALTGFEDEELTGFEEQNDNSGRTYGAELPCLEQLSTKKIKHIDSTRYVIGRSKQRANFCIENNSKISNVHAIIIQKNNRYYLLDNESKNGTFFNGNRVHSGITIELYDGMEFQIYNEEFIFHC